MKREDIVGQFIIDMKANGDDVVIIIDSGENFTTCKSPDVADKRVLQLVLNEGLRIAGAITEVPPPNIEN